MCFLSSLRLLNMLIIAAERARMRSVRHFHLTTTGTVRKRSRLEKHMSDQSEQQRPLTTTDAGSPAPSDDTSLTVGANGPVLLQDAYLIEKLSHFVRERVPDRVYHVKGGGAFGYFEVSADVTQWTRAAFLNKVGKRTPMLIRFSSVAGEEGYPDTDRDVRGYAMKFYTEEGNYDLVGNNTPVFFVRDPMKV